MQHSKKSLNISQNSKQKKNKKTKTKPSTWGSGRRADQGSPLPEKRGQARTHPPDCGLQDSGPVARRSRRPASTTRPQILFLNEVVSRLIIKKAKEKTSLLLTQALSTLLLSHLKARNGPAAGPAPEPALHTSRERRAVPSFRSLGDH